MHIRLSSPGLTGRPGIPGTAVIEAISRGVLDAPPEPVIGLAKGETRWRGMTVLLAAIIRLLPVSEGEND
jgi:hypothetical protein